MEIDRFFKEKIRFCIVDAEDIQCSSTWFLREANNSLYLAPSILGNQIKLSIHPNGVMQYSTDKKHYDKLKDEGVVGPFPFFRWQRLQPAPKQINRIVRLLFPSDFLRDGYPDPPSAKPKLVFSRPDSGFAVEVALFSSFDVPLGDEEQLLAEASYKPIVRYALDGEQISLAAKMTKFDPRHLAFDSTASPSWLTAHPPLEDDLRGLRAIVVMKKPEDGEEIVLAEAGNVSLARRA